MILTIIFALLQGYFFPESPVWPIGVFAMIMIVVFTRYCKW
ncbi:putative membrane protein [Klebsiella michiganensis]|nr:putative membrane protein [Klebsiella michiganensis]